MPRDPATLSRDTYFDTATRCRAEFDEAVRQSQKTIAEGRAVLNGMRSDGEIPDHEDRWRAIL